VSLANSARLGDLVDVLSGFAFDAADFSDQGELPVVRIRDVVRGRSSTYFLGIYDDRYLIDSGDILIGMDGEFNRARWSSGKALLNQRVCKIAPIDAALDKAYLFHFLPRVLKTIEDATSFVTVKHLSAKQIREIQIPLPAIAEQRRIAAILDQAETLRIQRRATLAQLDSLAQSIFLDAIGDPATNEKGWPLSVIGAVSDVQGGLQVTTARKNLPLEVPYLRVANVYRGFLDLGEIKTIRATAAEVSRTTLVKNDLLVVEGHGNPNEIGRCALWTSEVAGCVHQNHIIRVRFDSAKIVPKFACEYLNSQGGRRHLLRAGKTTSGLNTISVSNVRETPVALPPLALQEVFAARLQAIESLKVTHRAALVKLDALFASLQHRAFRGEL
jgi:type I restriction enzyme, S subunit